jgi:hypothetical protein
MVNKDLLKLFAIIVSIIFTFGRFWQFFQKLNNKNNFSVIYISIFDDNSEIREQIHDEEEMIHEPRNIPYDKSTLEKLKLNDEFISNIPLKHTKTLSKTPLIVTASSENHFDELIALLNTVMTNFAGKQKDNV